VWRSLVAHLLWEQGAGGSNPLTPTTSTNKKPVMIILYVLKGKSGKRSICITNDLPNSLYIHRLIKSKASHDPTSFAIILSLADEFLHVSAFGTPPEDIA
jgi:hypothetical protein